MTALEQASKMVNKRLTSDKPLMQSLPGGVHRDEAPAKTPMPYLVYQVDGNGSDNSLNGSPGVVEAELLARVVGEGVGIGLLQRAEQQMNTLLTGWNEDDNAGKLSVCCSYSNPYNTTFSGGGFDGLPALGATFRLQLMPHDGGTADGS